MPILATKADNLEGDWTASTLATARLAAEYDLPLWNFWAAANPLPHGGLNADGFHLTYDINKFRDLADPKNTYGWPVRNLTALEALDAVWRAVSNKKPRSNHEEHEGHKEDYFKREKIKILMFFFVISPALAAGECCALCGLISFLFSQVK